MTRLVTSRRRLIGCFVALLLPWIGAALHAAEKQPNILFAIADDWSWPHASIYDDKVVKTPTFDRVAREGVLFTNAYCATPSCTASRSAILTGQTPHRLEDAANLWSLLPAKYDVYPDLLEDAGYVVGYMRKGWGPGTIEEAGRSRNPAGPQFKSFAEFHQTVGDDKPFCFWFGSQDPHRTYAPRSGVASGMKIEDVEVPPYLHDSPTVRSDMCDYYWEVQRFDREVGEILNALEASGKLDNTLVVITSDNGMPFPRAKANLYDAGTRMPLAIRWPRSIAEPGRRYDGFVSFVDLAPTFLVAAGLKATADMHGKPLQDVFKGCEPGDRPMVFFERERHGNVREGNLSYPARGVRTKDFLYIKNFRPDRWPAGDPEMHDPARNFGDIDDSPTKRELLDRRDDPAIKPLFNLACAERPAEELYDLKHDPHQLTNLAGDEQYARIKRELFEELWRWMVKTGDPRASANDDRYDHYRYFRPDRRQVKKPSQE